MAQRQIEKPSLRIETDTMLDGAALRVHRHWRGALPARAENPVDPCDGRIGVAAFRRHPQRRRTGDALIRKQKPAARLTERPPLQQRLRKRRLRRRQQRTRMARRGVPRCLLRMARRAGLARRHKNAR